MKNQMKIIFIIIGTLIGAGFASGKEIEIFFFQYGVYGIIGMSISIALIGIVIYRTLLIVKNKKTQNYKEFLKQISEKTNIKSKKIIIETSNLLINTFTLITFFIMIAGFGSYFQEQIGINKIIGSTILALICLIIFKTDIQGVMKANEIVVPILIIILTLLSILNLKNIQQIQLITTNGSNWIISALEYSGYNILLLIPVLITLKEFLDNKKITKKQIANIAIIVAIVVLILAMGIFTMLMQNQNIFKNEMPIAKVISNMSQIYIIAYGVLIMFSIFTTSIALGTSFLKNTKYNYNAKAIVICIISILVSNIGFSNLINVTYPFFGILGIIEIFFVCFFKKDIVK